MADTRTVFVGPLVGPFAVPFAGPTGGAVQAAAHSPLAWLQRLLEGNATDQAAVWRALDDAPPPLRDEVRRLYAFSAHSTDALLPPPQAVHGLALCPGQQVDGRRLLRRIGQGGMAEVWLAQRLAPPHREEAIKFPTLVLASGRQVERFERERDVLARLEHPGIARLYGAGVAGGRPYIVMEYVQGLPIGEACNQQRLGLRERLQVFVQLLAAVDHVHRHMVVHRDIKPSNVLMDDHGRARLLDFGIAKLLADSADAAPELTQDAGCALSAAYAAPEQIQQAPISTATDLYALGMLLSELVTGRTPRAAMLAAQGAAGAQGEGDAAARLRGTLLAEVPRLSSVVVDKPDDDAPQAITLMSMGMAPAALRRALQGDLDTIVAKTLRRDPAERYPSAAALADDIGRYLAQRPIQARRPSLAYAAGRFVQRHRAGVALSALALLALGGAGAYALQQQQAATLSHERVRGVEAVVNNLLESIGPDQAPSRQFTAESVLDIAQQAIDRDRAIGADERRAINHRFADLYTRIGAHDQAARGWQQHIAFGERAGDVLAVAEGRMRMAELALMQHRFGEVERWLVAANAAVPSEPALAAAHHRNLLLRGEWLLHTGRAREAAPLLLRAQAALQQAAPTDLEWLARAAHARGIAARRTGDMVLAEAQLQQSLALHSRRGTAALMDRSGVALDLGALDNWRGRYAQAAERMEPACTLVQTRQGAMHERAMGCARDLAQVLLRLGRFDAMAHWAQLCRAGVAGRPDYQRNAEFVDRLEVRAAAYRGDPDAEPRMRAALVVAEARVGGTDAETESLRRALGELLLRQGRQSEALAVLTRTLQRQSELFGPAHVSVALTRVPWGVAQARLGHEAGAVAAWQQAAAALAKEVGEDHPSHHAAMAYLSLAAQRGHAVVPAPTEPEQRGALAARLQQSLGWQPGASELAKAVASGDARTEWQRIPVVL